VKKRLEAYGGRPCLSALELGGRQEREPIGEIGQQGRRAPVVGRSLSQVPSPMRLMTTVKKRESLVPSRAHPRRQLLGPMTAARQSSFGATARLPSFFTSTRPPYFQMRSRRDGSSMMYATIFLAARRSRIGRTPIQ